MQVNKFAENEKIECGPLWSVKKKLNAELKVVFILEKQYAGCPQNIEIVKYYTAFSALVAVGSTISDCRRKKIESEKKPSTQSPSSQESVTATDRQ